MNYLAHLLLGDDDGLLLVGSLAGDFLRGRPEGLNLPPRLEAGVRLHRRVDSFSDAHPVARRARLRLPAHRRRAAGIVVDVAFDHFLARRWDEYSDEGLAEFTDRVYDRLHRHRHLLPPGLGTIVPTMARDDWLARYRDADEVARVLDRMAGRLSRPQLLRGAGAELFAAYDGLERDFRDFFPDVCALAQDWRASRRC